MGTAQIPRLPAHDARPLYAQIVDVLEQEINSGRLKPGDRLPTQERLAQHFGVSLAPVKQALRGLERRGIVATHQGRGTYVMDATPLSEEIIKENRIPHFTRDVRESGRTPTAIVLRVERLQGRDAPRVAGELKLAGDDQLVCVERVRLADDEPLSLQAGYFPQRLVPGLVERGLGDESLTEVLQAEYGMVVAVSRQTISATAATKRDADHLGVNIGDPLLLVERTSYLSTNEPMEVVTDRRVPHFNFVVWLRRQ